MWPVQVIAPQLHEAAAHLLFVNPDDPDDPGLGRCFGFVSQFDRSSELAESGATYDAAGDTWRKWRDGDKIRSQYKGPVNPDE